MGFTNAILLSVSAYTLPANTTIIKSTIIFFIIQIPFIGQRLKAPALLAFNTSVMVCCLVSRNTLIVEITNPTFQNFPLTAAVSAVYPYPEYLLRFNFYHMFNNILFSWSATHIE